jgi:NADH-quinone oxidoreductase subunit F
MSAGRGEKGDAAELVRLASNIKGKTLCPMGDAASLPILSLAQKFKNELESCLKDG